MFDFPLIHIDGGERCVLLAVVDQLVVADQLL